MLDKETRQALSEKVREQTVLGAKRLAKMRVEVRPLRNQTKTITSGSGGMSVAIMATDGGESAFQFDPFMIQTVRVASSNNGDSTRQLDVISSETEPAALLARQYEPGTGKPLTALTRMMDVLGVRSLNDLCSSIPKSSIPTN